MGGARRSVVALEQRRSRLLAPRQGGGVRCAAMVGCIVRLYTRCAASLRMTRRGAAARDEKQNAVSVSFTVLYFTPNKLRITPLSPTCHPERSGTAFYIQARPPTIATQRTPPRQGGGVRCAALFGCIVRPYTRCAASLRMTRG